MTETGCPLNDDVLRRDFTVNAIAISLNRNNLFEIVDYLGGQEDLSKKQLRILHKKSFYDDPSRIIRGLKFAVRLGFTLEEETKMLQEEYLENPLKNIPLERVKSEIKELFSLRFGELYGLSLMYNILFSGMYKTDKVLLDPSLAILKLHK